MPLQKRREWLEKIEKIRGKVATDELKAEMERQYKCSKND